MTRLDRFIQRWRIRRAAAFIPPPVRVIDVGAYHGEFFDYLGDRLAAGYGIEPLLNAPRRTSRYKIHPGLFPDVRPPSGGWDAVTLLAVFEPIPPSAQARIAAACAALLTPGGRLIITVPSPAVALMLAALRFCRLIDGMSLKQHYGFKPADTLEIFTAPHFCLHRRQSFQLGLNHLFVFEKI